MDRSEIRALLGLPLMELVAKANKVRRNAAGDGIELCTIMNAKSGECAEDCKFCAQSARHSTGISTYPLRGKGEMVKAAERAKAIGAHRFDIVTSGDSLSKDELRNIIEAISEIRSRMDI